MTSLLKRFLQRAAVARRRLSRTPVLTFKLTEPKLGDMADPLNHATGLEKKEMLAYKAGNKDPFYCRYMLKRTGGTSKENAIEVPSAFDGRLVGCLCQENRFAQWMWLEECEPKRCECGYWFKIKPIKPL